MTPSPLYTRTPTGVRMIGFFYEGRPDKEKIESCTKAIAKAAGIKDPKAEKEPPSPQGSQDRLISLIIRGEKKADKGPYQLVVKALVGYDYCVYMLILSARDDNYEAPLTEVAGELKCIGLDTVFSNDRQLDVEVYTCRQVLGTPPEEVPLELFDDAGRPSAMSRWQGLPIPLLCACWSHLNRYVVIPALLIEASPPATITDQNRVISQVLDDLARLEVYRHKLHLNYKHYRKNYGEIEGQEKQVDKVIEARKELKNANIKDLRQTLDGISERFVDLSRLAYAIQHSDYVANANRINLERQLQSWDEARILDYPLLSLLFLPEARQIAATLGQFSKRIEGARTELDSLVQVIRTRVDLDQQQELIKMQHAMNMLEFLVLAGILFPLLKGFSTFLERMWGAQYGDWPLVIASIFLSLLLLRLVNWVRDRS